MGSVCLCISYTNCSRWPRKGDGLLANAVNLQRRKLSRKSQHGSAVLYSSSHALCLYSRAFEIGGEFLSTACPLRVYMCIGMVQCAFTVSSLNLCFTSNIFIGVLHP